MSIRIHKELLVASCSPSSFVPKLNRAIRPRVSTTQSKALFDFFFSKNSPWKTFPTRAWAYLAIRSDAIASCAVLWCHTGSWCRFQRLRLVSLILSSQESLAREVYTYIAFLFVAQIIYRISTTVHVMIIGLLKRTFCSDLCVKTMT